MVVFYDSIKSYNIEWTFSVDLYNLSYNHAKHFIQCSCFLLDIWTFEDKPI